MHDMFLRAWIKVHDDRGAGVVEYVLLIALIALLIIAAALFFKNALVSQFSSIGSSVQNA